MKVISRFFKYLLKKPKKMIGSDVYGNRYYEEGIFRILLHRTYEHFECIYKGLRFVKSKQGDPLYVTVPKENASKITGCISFLN